MANAVEHESKFAALHRQRWRLQMSEKFSSGTINPKQTNKQQQKPMLYNILIGDFDMFYLMKFKKRQVKYM